MLGVLIVAALAVYLYSERVARSPLGRMMRAVRDNETSSEAIGKDIVGIRRNVLNYASALSGVAGVLFVLWSPAVSPCTFLRLSWTFYPFVIVILGGVANNLGVGVGTAVFVGITTTIDQARTCIISNGISLPVDINAIEPIAIGVLLLVVLLGRPKELKQEKPSATLSRSRLKDISERAKGAAKQESTSLPEEKSQTASKTTKTQEDSD